MISDKKFNILLVDDDEIDVMSFERSLKRAEIDYKLDSFVYSADAISFLDKSNGNIDCVFLDYMLPKTTGLELLEKIKPSLKEVPIIIITSHGDERLAVDIMKAGAFDYITKNDVNADNFKKLFHSIDRHNSISNRSEVAEQELETQRNFINKVTSQTPAVIYVYDIPLKKFIYINNPWSSVLGHKASTNTLAGLLKFSSEENKESLNKHFSRDIEPTNYNKEVALEFYLKNAKDKEVCFKSIEKGFKIENGVITQLLGIATDVTSHKEYEKEISLQKTNALRAASAKSEFLSNMSHEIRTPMNAIIGLTNILLDNKEFEGQNLENLNSIKYSAENLLIIINDILDLSKIESGKLNFESLNFSLHDKMDVFYKIMEFKASDKGLDFSVNIDEKIPKFLIGDPYRLNQILINVAGNAIKFTDTGSVSVDISCANHSNKNGVLKFAIKDTGIGIPKNALKKIFESYSQAYTNTTRLFGGTGLGLTITKKLVEHQKGSISVKSELGVGSEFTIYLPFMLGKEIVKTTDESIKQNVDIVKGMHVLIAEDNKVNQLVLKLVLKGWGCKFDIANNGEEAVESFSKNKYDIVLMDLQMPILNGYQATEGIREIEQNNNSKNPIYIVALTADAFPETKQNVLIKGFNDFLAKPFNSEDLLLILSSVVENNKQ